MTLGGFAKLTPEEAAEHIFDNALVGFSGFTAAGAAKAVPRALAAKANQLHAAGKPFRLRVLVGASTGAPLDEALAQAEAISWRAAYQSAPTLRKQINAQQVDFVDLHLSHVPQLLEYGFLGKVDVAVVEAVDVMPDGRVYLSTSSGISPSLLRAAEKVIIEINQYHSKRLAEMHDVARLPKPPQRVPIQILFPLTKCGTPFAMVDPERVVGIVETNEPDGVSGFAPANEVSERIAEHVVRFLVDEQRAGRIPKAFLPLQAGVGNVANAVMASLGTCPDIPPFSMFTEVFQDSLVPLMQQGRLTGASTCSLTLSPAQLTNVYDNMDFFTKRLVIRPQELSNNPGVIRRLGVIALNTALEIDIYGNANSTHIGGTSLMNGIGGSGDFVRNSYLSILMAPSTTKGGKISTVVPMVSHTDHNEHSVQIMVTEQGLADLRGLGPMQRANRIIECCAHPDYRDYLKDYIERSPMGHLRHDLARAFELHLNLQKYGTMLPRS